MELSELSSQQEASLFRSGLKEWQEGPQVLTYGAILIEQFSYPIRLHFIRTILRIALKILMKTDEERL